MNLFKTLTRRKPLLWIGSLIGGLVLVVAVAAIYVGTRPDDWWRDQLTTALSQTLGRQVEIQAFSLDLEVSERFTPQRFTGGFVHEATAQLIMPEPDITQVDLTFLFQIELGHLSEKGIFPYLTFDSLSATIYFPGAEQN